MNIAQLILTCRDENQKNSVFGLALVSLNMADLLASFITLFGGATFFVAMLDCDFFKNAKRPFLAATVFPVTSSITHVVFIAIQRVIAVALPLRVGRILTRSRCHVILALLWAISVAIAVFIYFHPKLGGMSLTVVIIALGIALVVIYSVICCKTMKRSIVNDVTGDMQRRRRQSEKQMVKYAVAISAVFIVCNYPRSLYNFIEYPSTLLNVSVFLYCINPSMDTLLYFMSSYCKRRRERRRERSSPASTPMGNIQLRNFRQYQM